MGTCSALIHASLLPRIETRADCKIISVSDFGEDLLQIRLEHDSFDGYVGQQCVILEGDNIRFKQDLDV